MTPKETELTTTELKEENRQLREAIECLCDCLEGDNSSPTPDRARDALGKAKQSDEIKPPWKREGYKSKEAWLDSKRDEQ